MQTFVADLITSPAVTPLLAAARARKCRTLTGEQMFQPQVGLLADILVGPPRLAHVPAKRTPVRRQGHAPRQIGIATRAP